MDDDLLARYRAKAQEHVAGLPPMPEANWQAIQRSVLQAKREAMTPDEWVERMAERMPPTTEEQRQSMLRRRLWYARHRPTKAEN